MDSLENYGEGSGERGGLVELHFLAEGDELAEPKGVNGEPIGFSKYPEGRLELRVEDGEQDQADSELEQGGAERQWVRQTL